MHDDNGCMETSWDEKIVIVDAEAFLDGPILALVSHACRLGYSIRCSEVIK